MNKSNLIIRKGKFDAGHRLLDHPSLCKNIHGHEYHYEIAMQFQMVEKIGYALDFSEIKSKFCAWVDHAMDHGFLVNPQDLLMKKTLQESSSKTYLMHLVDESGYCNPTAENIAKELFFAAEQLFFSTQTLKVHSILLQETMNCRVVIESLTDQERSLLMSQKGWVAGLRSFGL